MIHQKDNRNFFNWKRDNGGLNRRWREKKTEHFVQPNYIERVFVWGVFSGSHGGATPTNPVLPFEWEYAQARFQGRMTAISLFASQPFEEEISNKWIIL